MDKDLHDIIAAIEMWCDIGKDLFSLSPADFIDRVVTPLQDHTEYQFDWQMGASKGVLIFETQDIVIKIPFAAAEYDEGQYQYDKEAWEAEEIKEEPNLEDYVYDLSQAENFFIETSGCWDYCELECGIYAEAVKEGLEAYFAKEECVAKVRGYPIYSQILVSPYNEDIRSHSRSEEERKKTSASCSRMGVDCFNANWITDFFECYGEDEFKRLSNFLEKLCIHDLHSGNIGYLGHYPILLDYSNYNE